MKRDTIYHVRLMASFPGLEADLKRKHLEMVAKNFPHSKAKELRPVRAGKR